jgi:hypothetical protein
MILVFDMVLSLWALIIVPISIQRVLDFIPEGGLDSEKILR